MALEVSGLVSLFSQHLYLLGMRARTRDAYCRAVACLLESNKDPVEFVKELSAPRAAVCMAAVRRLLTFLADKGFAALAARLAPVNTPAVSRHVQNLMLRHRIENTKERPTVQATSFDGLWTAAGIALGEERADRLLRPALVLGLLCGLRRGDLLAARWDWVNWDERTILIPDPKGGRPYQVPLSDLAAARLQALVARRKEQGSECSILQSPRGQRASTNRTTLTRELALLEITPHALRRGFATGMLNKGVPAATVAKLMNHKSPETTFKNYYTPDKEVLRDAVSRLSETPED